MHSGHRFAHGNHNRLVKLEPNIEIITDMQDLELRIEHDVCPHCLRIHSI